METARDIRAHRKFWAARFGTAPFLPMSRAEMDALGWDSCDIIIVTGDAYVDHPSFGMAIIGRVLEEIPDSQLTGHPENRLPNHASFVFKDVDGNLLLQLLDANGFACSSGSACKTGNPEPSEVITALGLARDWALGSLRVTLGKDSTPAQVDSFLSALPGLVENARNINRR